MGDVVEIVRNGATLHGRLAYKLSVGVTPNPRWLVTFDDHPHKDEELYEKAFGDLIKSADEEAAPVGPPPRRARLSISSNNSSVHSSRKPPRGGSGSSEEGEKIDDKSDEKIDDKKINHKSVSFSEARAPAASAKPATAVRKAAREQRSLRRQAKIDTDVVPLIAQPGGVVQQQLSNSITKKRRIPPPKNNNKRLKSEEGEEVVKVILLTGTLYLYRGLHRRAEFIRRI